MCEVRYLTKKSNRDLLGQSWRFKAGMSDGQSSDTMLRDTGKTFNRKT